MTRKIASTFVALVAAVALLSGCGAASPIQTSENYAPSDGVRLEFSNGVRLENFFLLTADEGAPVRLMGAIVNDAESDADVQLDIDGQLVEVTAPASGVLNLEAEEIVIEGVSALPGTNLAVMINSGGSQTYEIPVLDGTLPPYDEFLP